MDTFKFVAFLILFLIILIDWSIPFESVFGQLPNAWSLQTSGTPEDLYSVKAVGQDVAWICGSGGTVLRTTNGGTTWEDVSCSIWGVNDLYHVFANDENTSYVIANPSDGGHIYKTTTGGANWYQVFFLSGGFINAVYINGLNGYGVGDPVGDKWTVIKTTDGGESWFRMTTEPAVASSSHYGYNNCFQVIDSNMWFGTNASRIYRSTDLGLTWEFTATSFTSAYDLQFTNAANGIVAGTGIQRTLNGGATLTNITVPGTGSFGALAGVGYTEYWVGRNTTIYHTYSTGDNWTNQFTMPANICAMDMTETQYGFQRAGWAVGQNGTIAAYKDGVDVEEWKDNHPENFILFSNTPNPFNPSTVIRYQLAVSRKVTMKIFNILGQEVRTLVNKQQSAGIHSIVWDGKNNQGQRVSSGVYLYRLEAGDFVKTKKMVLVK